MLKAQRCVTHDLISLMAKSIRTQVELFRAVMTSQNGYQTRVAQRTAQTQWTSGCMTTLVLSSGSTWAQEE